MSINEEALRDLFASAAALDKELEQLLPQLKEAPLDLQLQLLAMAERCHPGTGARLLQGKVSGNSIILEVMGLLDDD